MSKKKQTPILSDKIAELIAPRRLLDPEIDSDDETAARAIDYEIDDDINGNEPVSQLSDIRRKNVKLLHDVDAKYEGRVSSRKELEMDTDESIGSDDDGDNGDDDDDDEDAVYSDKCDENDMESTDQSMGKFSMLLTPRQKIKLAQNEDDSNEENSIENGESSDDDENDIKSFAMKLKQSKQTTAPESDSDGEFDAANDESKLDKWDDDYEGEEESMNGSDKEINSADSVDEDDEDGSDGSDEEESDFDGGDMMPTEISTEPKEKDDLSRILPKQHSDNQINKGVCVQNQLQIWEKLLEVRIHSQKMLIKANSMPQPSKFECLAQKSDEFSELANRTFDNVETLLTQMRDLQSHLLNQYGETKELAKKRKRSPMNDAKADPETKRNRLSDELTDDFTNFKEYQYSVISKWHDRTKVLTPGSIKTQKQQGNIDVLRKIEAVLANRSDLIKKSQLLKGGYELFDKNTGIVEAKQSNEPEANGANDDNENHNDDSIYSSEVYDDTDFYHTQLRELIEYKTSSSNNVNEVAKQFAELQKLRKKMKKAVDTRASKGRKIRYVVHNKLVSFMAPNHSANWTDEQKEELFKSIFGAQS